MWPFSTLMRDTAVQAGVESRDGYDIDGWLARVTDPTHSGVSITEDNSVQLPAVYKCVSLNAETISGLPIDVYAKRGSGRVTYTDPVWLREPNALQTLREFIAMTQLSLDLDGNAFWRKLWDGEKLIGLDVIPPQAVDVELVQGVGIQYTVPINNVKRPFGKRDIVHLRGTTMPGELRGLSPIQCARQTIGIGKAAEQFGAQFFGSGATLSGVITAQTSLNKEQVDRLKEDFAKKHSGINASHEPGVLSGGATWTPLSVKPEEAQFLASREYTKDEVGQIFGFPAGFFSADGSKGYVTALAQMLRLWNIQGIMPRCIRIEEAFSSLLPRGVYVKFNRNALLQMDPAARVAFYQAGQLGEWITRNEIREKEDMDPIEGGDEFLHSVQWQQNAPPDSGGTGDSSEPASAGSPVKEAGQ